MDKRIESVNFQELSSAGTNSLRKLMELRSVQHDQNASPEEKETTLVFAWLISNMCIRFVSLHSKDNVVLTVNILAQGPTAAPYLSCGEHSYYLPRYIYNEAQLISILRSIAHATEETLHFEANFDMDHPVNCARCRDRSCDSYRQLKSIKISFNI